MCCAHTGSRWRRPRPRLSTRPSPVRASPPTLPPPTTQLPDHQTHTVLLSLPTLHPIPSLNPIAPLFHTHARLQGRHRRAHQGGAGRRHVWQEPHGAQPRARGGGVDAGDVRGDRGADPAEGVGLRRLLRGCVLWYALGWFGVCDWFGLGVFVGARFGMCDGWFDLVWFWWVWTKDRTGLCASPSLVWMISK